MNLMNVWYIWNKDALKEHKPPVLLISYSKSKANEMATFLDILMSPSSKDKEPYQVSKGVISNDDLKQILEDKSNKEVRGVAQELIHNHDLFFAKNNIKAMRNKAELLLKQKEATDSKLKQIENSLQKKLNIASKNLSKDLANHNIQNRIDVLNNYITIFLVDEKFDCKRTTLNKITKKRFFDITMCVKDIHFFLKFGIKFFRDNQSSVEADLLKISEILPKLNNYVSNDTLKDLKAIKFNVKKLK